MEREAPSIKNNGVVESPKQESKPPLSDQGSPSSQDTSDADVKAIEEFVEGVAEKWRAFGEAVGVMDTQLDEVEERGVGAREACMEVFQLWKVLFNLFCLCHAFVTSLTSIHSHAHPLIPTPTHSSLHPPIHTHPPTHTPTPTFQQAASDEVTVDMMNEVLKLINH